MMNKKAQTNWIQIIGGLIAMAVLVMVVLFVAGFFEKLDEPKDIIPDKLSLKASVCGKALNQINFCQFAEVGEDIYVNCEYSDANFQASFETGDFSCEDTDVFTTEQKHCIFLNPSDTSKVQVNEQTCAKHLGPETGAE